MVPPMPVNIDPNDHNPLFQRDQYNKGGLGARYWDLRDSAALQFIGEEDRILVDLGCGEGITLERIHNSFPDKSAVGIDFLDQNVEICRAHGLTAQKGDLYRLPIGADSVDVVLFLEVLEHLRHPDQALREIYRILKPGGKAVVIVPNDRTFYWARILTLRFREASYDPGHLLQWTPKMLEDALVQSGFSIQCTKNLPFYFWPLSLHCLAVAVKR